MNINLKYTEKAFEVFGIIWFIIIICVAIFSLGRCCAKHYRKPPIERKIDVDSIAKLNDSIKIKINNLDSIKNAKVIEVISLDNDSSIKLFYELVSE